jgi:hypothetical protein
LNPRYPGRYRKARLSGRAGAVVRLVARVLGTGFMAAYPGSREPGWTASH